jgi:transcriptional regulator with XRE-family HTH domain
LSIEAKRGDGKYAIFEKQVRGQRCVRLMKEKSYSLILTQALTELREKLGLTQEALAREAGVTVRTIARYEAGLGPELHPVIARLARVAVNHQLQPIAVMLLGADLVPLLCGIEGKKEQTWRRKAQPVVVPDMVNCAMRLSALFAVEAREHTTRYRTFRLLCVSDGCCAVWMRSRNLSTACVNSTGMRSSFIKVWRVAPSEKVSKSSSASVNCSVIFSSGGISFSEGISQFLRLIR